MDYSARRSGTRPSRSSPAHGLRFRGARAELSGWRSTDARGLSTRDIEDTFTDDTADGFCRGRR